jgi:hypothetical protein
MLKVVLRAQLNLHSKYTLEKLKLKAILSNLHGEINKRGEVLHLKGGMDNQNLIIHKMQ